MTMRVSFGNNAGMRGKAYLISAAGHYAVAGAEAGKHLYVAAVVGS